VFLASIASLLLAAALPETILAGDAEAYRDRMAEMFSGQIPYLEFNFEHLPGAIVPMSVAWLLGGSQNLQAFALALAGFSALLIAVTGLLLIDLESDLGTGLAVRWVGAVVPLLPFLLFRNDSLSVLLTVGAFWAATRPRARVGAGIVPAWLGVATKLWSGSWAVIEWWRGRRTWAVATTILTVGGVVLLRTAPILAIQRPVGVHTETLAGSLLGAFRQMRGLPLHLRQTSALYIEAEWWAHLINVIPAIALAVAALSILRRRFAWAQAWALFGVLTGCLMVASPLFSTQYMAWISPFASTQRRPWAVLVMTNVLSLGLIVTWNRGLDGSGWWFWLGVGRNLMFLTLLSMLVVGVLRSPSLSPVQRAPMTEGYL
jgi:hypothetical protein